MWWKKVKKVWKCNLKHCNRRCNVSHSQAKFVWYCRPQAFPHQFGCLLSAYLYKPLLVSNGSHEHLEDLLFIDCILSLPRSGARTARILSAKSKIIPANSTDPNITTATVVAARSQCPPNMLWLSYEMEAFRSSRIMGKDCASVRFVWWSGGLGNSGNALPRCQLQNIS